MSRRRRQRLARRTALPTRRRWAALPSRGRRAALATSSRKLSDCQCRLVLSTGRDESAPRLAKRCAPLLTVSADLGSEIEGRPHVRDECRFRCRWGANRSRIDRTRGGYSYRLNRPRDAARRRPFAPTARTTCAAAPAAPASEAQPAAATAHRSIRTACGCVESSGPTAMIACSTSASASCVYTVWKRPVVQLALFPDSDKPITGPARQVAAAQAAGRVSRHQLVRVIVLLHHRTSERRPAAAAAVAASVAPPAPPTAPAASSTSIARSHRAPRSVRTWNRNREAERTSRL